MLLHYISMQLEEALDFALAVDVYSYSLEPNLPGVSGHVSIIDGFYSVQ